MYKLLSKKHSHIYVDMLSACLYQLRRIIILGLLLSFGVSVPQSAAVDLRGTTQLEADFFKDVRDRKTSKWSLSDAFFIASGIRTESDLNKARTWLEDKVRQAKAALSSHRGVKAKADHLLRWVHAQMFSRYRATATDALEIIRSGQFNCLSSCIIYGIIAQKLGLKVRGVAVDRHAFCRVYQGRRGWDVETTTPMGFNPGRKIQIEQAVVSVPRNQYRNRRELRLFEMIGLIYTNHMGLSRAFPTTRDRLLAYQKAVLFFPKDKKMRHNLIALHTEVIAEELNYKRWNSAYLYVEQLKKHDTRNKYWPDLTLTIIDKIVGNMVQARRMRKATEFLEQQAQQFPELVRPIGYLLGSILAQSAQAWIQARKFTQGRSWFLEALEAPSRAKSLGRSSRKRSAIRISRGAMKVYQHNYFAGLNNAMITSLKHRNSSLAKELARASMKRYPSQKSKFKQFLRSAQDMETEERQREAYDEIMRSTKKQNWTQALKQTQSALKRYPQSRTFIELKNKIEPIKLATDIVELINNDKRTRARRRLRSALAKYPRHNALRQVTQMLERDPYQR